jgi:hypothetical protein
MEIVHIEGKDSEDMSKKLVEAELKICKKIEDIAYAAGKHPDDVFVNLLIQFSEFVEKQYPIKEYSNEKSAKEQIKKIRS